MKYCLDTSALIEPWVRLYPPDIFPPVWRKLEELVEDGSLRAPVEVRRELERQSDDLYKWARESDDLFVELDAAQARKAKEVVNTFPNLVKPNSTKSQADPFVIALAEISGVPVVTYETMAKKKDAPKIPNVCESRKLKVLTLVELLRAESFRM
jgi:hypothetical protein